MKFDDDFGEEFPVSGGVCVGEKANEYYVNPRMWAKAVDLVLDRLILSGADFSTVASISGSAQQHGSVYWNAHGIETLQNLDVDKFLHNQIDEFAFAISRNIRIRIELGSVSFLADVNTITLAISRDLSDPLNDDFYHDE